jgi:hypothetical protein
MDYYHRFLVKDQRLHAELDDGADAVPAAAKAMVLGPQEAARQLEEPPAKRQKTSPVDFDDLVQQWIVDDGLTSDVMASRLNKAALARQFCEKSSQQLALMDRLNAIDVQTREAEAQAKIDATRAETQAPSSVCLWTRRRRRTSGPGCARRSRPSRTRPGLTGTSASGSASTPPR